MTRRAAWTLVAAGTWTLYVWISRIVILAGQDDSTSFKVVHFTLAVVSIAFGIAVGWIGVRALRNRETPDPRLKEEAAPGL